MHKYIIMGVDYMYWNFFRVIGCQTAILALLVAPCLAAAGAVQNQSISTEQLVPLVDDKAKITSQGESFSLPPYGKLGALTAIDKKIIATMQEYNVVGLSAAVMRGDKIIWSKGYGWADLKTGRSATPETIFRSASISKMFTGTALMQLYEQKKFQLDDDISTYLGYQVRNPHFPNTPITFRQLMSHTSSIVDEGSYDKLIEERPELLNDIDIKEMLMPTGAFYEPTTFAEYEPGKGFNYSNFGTAISASLVEAIAHCTFADYCRKNIFNPLDMDASFQPVDINNWQKISVLYRSKDKNNVFYPTKDNYGAIKPVGVVRKAPLGSALGDSPAGGVRLSIMDLSKFMMAHMNGGTYNKRSILKKDIADLMHSFQWFGNGLDGLYKQKGLNFHITDELVPGQRLIGHAAEAYGLIGDAYYDPDTKYGLAFLINGGNYTTSAPYYPIENKLAKILYNEFAPKEENKRKIRGKLNEVILTVNDRKVVMPLPATEIKNKNGKTIFIPEITAADALKASIEQDAIGDRLIYTWGTNRVVLTVGNPELVVNGKKIILLQGPYKKDGHIMVPLIELRDALGQKGSIKF